MQHPVERAAFKGKQMQTRPALLGRTPATFFEKQHLYVSEARRAMPMRRLHVDGSAHCYDTAGQWQAHAYAYGVRLAGRKHCLEAPRQCRPELANTCAVHALCVQSRVRTSEACIGC